MLLIYKDENKIKADILIITNIPSFYKIRLYNKIAKSRNIIVLFWKKSVNNRTDDFYDEQIEFSFYFIQGRSFIGKLFNILRFLGKIDYNRLIISGWDSYYCWFVAYFSSKKYNAVVVESSCFESSVRGLKALLKKIYLSRFSVAFVPGENNEKLLKLLSFKGKIKKTYGVGIYNRVIPPIYEERHIIKNFLYVGRFSSEKNLFFLINQFNRLPQLALVIIGYGPLEFELKNMANNNVSFLGEIKNKDLPAFYRESDILLLPSLSEPWGLVIEEALNNGTPVIVSNKVGCINEIVINEWNGLIYDGTEFGFMNAITTITIPEIYNKIRKNVCSFNYEEREKMQINAYL
jgi:glycosyltransferase involved in cell wall biosynthesis